MENKKIKVSKCSIEEINKCDHPTSFKKWADKFVCEELIPIDCPRLLVCDGEPCLMGTLVTMNMTKPELEIEFPCKGCKKPTLREKEESLRKLILGE